MVCFLHLLVAFVALLVSAEGSHLDLKTPSCPDPEDIAPCVCSVDEDLQMTMDCSEVISEDQLAQVFSVDIPFPNFGELIILNNQYIQVLRKGALGPASFQSIMMRDGVLEEVEKEALSQSHTTATSIDLQRNKLSEFPFSELPSFTALQKLWLNVNSIAVFPTLISDNLLEIGLNANLFKEVPVDGFKSLKAIENILVGNNDITAFHSGTFTDMQNLEFVYSSVNLLTHLPEGLIAFSGRGNVLLPYNKISSITVNAITGMRNGLLDLRYNSLNTLPEEVFRPILMEGATLQINHNPLGCSCDMAWIITNADLMTQLDPEASCHDGVLLSDLDPSIYEEC